MKTLVVYYSFTGNTRRVAERIARELGADTAEIRTVTPYTGDYNAVVDQGQDEVNRGYCPPIQPMDKNAADYDRIIIGTPTWWYTMAPAVHTYLKANDWTGKTVVPFQTHAGWAGHTLKDMARACGGAKVAHSMDIRFDAEGNGRMVSSEKALAEWIAALKA